MSGQRFLSHSQLHEVLFDFLSPEDLLSYRCIHSVCDNLVIGFAKTQLQDVFGQDVLIEKELHVISSRAQTKNEVGVRQVHGCLVVLLKAHEEDIGKVFGGSVDGLRS